MKKFSARQYGIALVSLLEQTPEKQRSAVIRGFLQLLRRNRQFRALPAILAAAEQRRLEQANTVRVKARAARPLSAQLIQQLGKVLGQTVLLEEAIDPALHGGVSLTIGEYAIDYTVPALLNQLRTQLTHD